MRYFYLIDTTKNYAVCFSRKKALVNYALENCLPFDWYFVVNKSEIPKHIKTIVGNGICKDYHKKNDVLVMKDSLKDRRK